MLKHRVDRLSIRTSYRVEMINLYHSCQIGLSFTQIEYITFLDILVEHYSLSSNQMTRIQDSTNDETVVLKMYL